MNEQNYKYFFVVSERPLIVLDNFINSNLKSPLIYIELCYNKIENELMNKLIEKIDDFDNIYELIKINLDSDNKIKMIENNYNITNNLFENYSNIITNDIIDIKTKLFNYTYINGLNKKNNKVRNLNELDKSQEKYFPKKNNKYNKNGFKYRINFDNNNNNYHKFRNLESDSGKGSYNLYHIIQKFKKINKIFKSFYQTNLSTNYKKISNNLNIFLSKNEIYLVQLERSINITLYKFSKFFTPEKLENLKEKIYYQYNLINPYVINYLDNITNHILDFMNLLSTKSSNYETFFIQLNTTITSIYSELKNIINDKYDIINYGVLRNLEKAKSSQKKDLDFSISLTYNIVDLLPKAVNPEYLVREFQKEPFKISTGMEIFIGFGLEIGVEHFNNGEVNIYIDLYGEVSNSLFLEVGIYIKLDPNTELNFAAGLSLTLNYFRTGIKYEYKASEKKNSIVGYGETNNNMFKLYIYAEFKFYGISTKAELAAIIHPGNLTTLYEKTFYETEQKRAQIEEN